MKKIFSLSLMAVALLISGNAKAVNVANQQQLQNAINNCPAGGSVDIVVTQSFSVETLPIYMMGTKAEGSAMRTINLDLGGNTITSSTVKSTFELFKGVMNITGKGTIENTNENGTAIVLHGIYDEYEHWCDVTIGKDVNVSSTVLNGITIMEFEGLPYYANGDASYAGQPAYDENGAAYHYAKNAQEPDYRCPTTTTTTGNTAIAHQIEVTREDFTFDYTSTYRTYKTDVNAGSTTKASYRNYVTTATKSLANGVNLTINGYVYGKKYGIKVNGSLGTPSTYQPNIFVSKTGSVTCATASDNAKDKESIAVYSSGVSNITIEGYVAGSMGICLKAGNVVLNDAVVEATGSADSREPLHKESGSGVDGGAGSAIVIISDQSYGGGQSLTINGDTKVTAASGFAIEQAVVNGQGKEELHDVTLNGGILESGEEGAIKVVSDDANKYTIYSGSVEGTVQDENGQEKPMSELIPQDGNHNVMNIGTDDEPVYVISEGAPVEDTKDINSVAVGEDAKLSASDNMVMNNNMTVGILYITEGTKLVIADGKTLTAKKIVMGEEDQIVVPANGKLIITGNEGLYAHNEDNIILQAQGDQLATLIFKYSVAQNKQPFATVEYNSTAKQLANGGHTWNRLVMAFDGLNDYRTVNKNEIEKWATWGTWFQVWDPAQGWKEAEYDGLGNPILAAYQGVALSNVSKNGDAKYEFKGKLQGVNQGTLEVEEGWNYYGNSFTAPLDLNALLEQLPVTGIKLWDAAKQKYVDVTYPQGDFDSIDELPAMQTFMFKADEAATVELDYKKLIWDYNMGE